MITKQFLNDLGLSTVSEDEKAKMVVHIQETLEDRIGARIEKVVDDAAKMDEFDNLIASGDSQEVNNWLNNNVPNHQQIVAEETEKIKVEIKSQVSAIIQSGA